MLALAFTVTGVIGLLLSSWITAAFESPAFAGGMLLITAAALISTRFIPQAADPGSLFSITWKVALIVGLAQGLAAFPGISRSGMTIVAGLWVGQSRNSAAEFSFLLAVPTVLAASLFSLLQEPAIPNTDLSEILVAGIISFITGLLAIHWLMRWLQRGRLWWFSGYCAVVGVASLLVWGFDLL
jgi:undecaprenyl-diphosphatase